jgi:hypothetical protein
MSRFVLGEMLDALERLAALLAAVLVCRHGEPPVSTLRVDTSMVRRRGNSRSIGVDIAFSSEACQVRIRTQKNGVP